MTTTSHSMSFTGLDSPEANACLGPVGPGRRVERRDAQAPKAYRLTSRQAESHKIQPTA